MHGDNRKLFGVPDEILDITRSSGMVRKRRLIYRKSCFGHRKSFGLIGNVPGVPGGYRRPSGEVFRSNRVHGLWEDVFQPLVGWPTHQRRPMQLEGKKSKERIES